ncbi:EAL domain-containing protein, partial [Blautia pseudococcoides]|nr:EAL domain-containing protein [Blautia pseudococcoides]
SRNQFVVYLQPKISSSDRMAVGAEALIRYQSRDGSLVLPGNFLPLLEESQTVSQIDFFVFEFICSKIKEWSMEGKKGFPVSVNFSRYSLAQPHFIERLLGICEKYKISPKYLEIEITETVRSVNDIDIGTLIEKIREAGFIVTIDDFGTEYANLALLSAVEFDVLKLDKSMVDDVVKNPKARAIISSIVEMGKQMGIQIVAEGIETEEQLGVLRACGVELAQAFLFSKPIAVDEYEKRYLDK